MQTPPSEMIRFSRKIGNVLKRMKNQFSDFYFLIIVNIHRKLEWFEYKTFQKITIIRKIKIRKIWNLIFLSIQPIPDLSCKFDHFWRNIYFFLFKKKSCMIFWNIKIKKILHKWSNFHERTAIGWIKRKTKFQIFPIFIYPVMVIFRHFCSKNRQFSMNVSQ